MSPAGVGAEVHGAPRQPGDVAQRDDERTVEVQEASARLAVPAEVPLLERLAVVPDLTQPAARRGVHALAGADHPRHDVGVHLQLVREHADADPVEPAVEQEVVAEPAVVALEEGIDLGRRPRGEAVEELRRKPLFRSQHRGAHQERGAIHDVGEDAVPVRRIDVPRDPRVAAVVDVDGKPGGVHAPARRLARPRAAMLLDDP